MQCGIACLQMICSYYHKEYTLERLANCCFATTEGVSLLGISEAARKLGLNTTCGRMTIGQLAQVPLPCLLHAQDLALPVQELVIVDLVCHQTQKLPRGPKMDKLRRRQAEKLQGIGA